MAAAGDACRTSDESSAERGSGQVLDVAGVPELPELELPELELPEPELPELDEVVDALVDESVFGADADPDVVPDDDSVEPEPELEPEPLSPAAVDPGVDDEADFDFPPRLSVL